MRKHEKKSNKEDDFVAVDPLDMSDGEVQSNDEKNSNSKGSKAKSDRSKSKTISYKEVWENTDWKRKSPFYFSSDEESGDDDTKGVDVIFGSIHGWEPVALLLSLCSDSIMKIQSDVHNHDDLGETQTDLHDDLVNSDNENGYRYEFEKYSDAEDEDGTNSSEHKLVKRGITRLCKFRMTYGKNHWFSKAQRYFDVDSTARGLVMHRLGQLLRNFRMKLREKYILPNLDTPSKLNELPKNYSAIVNAEEWAAFVNYTATDAYKEKSAKGKTARSKNVYHHKMGRGGYVYVKEKMIEKKEIEADEEPPRGVMWLKGRLNKDGEFPDEEIRSLGEKLKDADDKIKEGTLNLDDGTDAMTVMFGKEKGGYARGVGSGVTYKKYFDLPRSRQATDERIELLQTQLDNERRERQEKDTLVKKFSTAQGVAVEFVQFLCKYLDVTPAARINNIDSSAYGRDGNSLSGCCTCKDVENSEEV
ncbi:ribonuclease H-like domain, reverse transcriptase, RNA-dependent DNA polymerase [Tanacetum coccineum]